MLGRLLRKIFRTQNERELNKLWPVVSEINGLEQEISALSDDGLKARAAEARDALRLARKEAEEEIKKTRDLIASATSEQERNRYKKQLKGIKNRIMDDRLPEVFAMVREAAARTIGLRHFDVQMLGGITLHQGRIAEMITGEGKTLVATLPVCLNAFTGESVHIVTVNDYLAKRDSEWMGPVYRFMGLSVGLIQHDMSPEEKKRSYGCDVAYGTNNEFGFDYLRDNMVIDGDGIVQRYPSFAIVDEVDSILIDEARTPLIISGPVDEPNEAYNRMRPLIEEVVRQQRRLVEDHLTALEMALRENRDEEAGNLLYLVHKADPKNKKFLDMVLKDRRVKTLVDRAQALFESKAMEKERDNFLEDLYYVFDEKAREATFSARGQKIMHERFGVEFMLEDIEASLAELAEEDIPDEEKAAKEAELAADYTAQQRNVESLKQLLKAYILFEKDVDYVIHENKIVIVDSFTGRMMPGRRFSEGIHEAIEAKERVEVQKESQTLATITLQNYFRMYDKLAGMTGTAKTEETEFEGIYLLPVLMVPPNRQLSRDNMPDRIYKTEKEKFNAIVENVAEWHEKGRPVLVGTISIERSEHLSRLLTARGIKHNVLNARYHEKEAHIIAQAGRYKAVTIATNMAGRGTDILLGGNPEYMARDAVDKLEIDDPGEREKACARFLEEAEQQTRQEHEKVVEAGGLHVMGTERHESRRIDNQLRGRAGRQGDPGSSRFCLSLEDDLMRIFGSDRIKTIMDKLGMEEGEVIENPLVTRAVRTAQKRVEMQNFEIRKHLLKYDDIMNRQREVIYRRRRMILEGGNLKEEFFECLSVGMESLLEKWDEDPVPEAFAKEAMYRYVINVKPEQLAGRPAAEIMELVMAAARKHYSIREKFLGEEDLRHLEKMIMLSLIDSNWKEYLREIDDLREGISWRAYAQKDPFVEFQHEAFRMFHELMTRIDLQTAERIMKISAMEERHKKAVFKPAEEMFEHKEYSSLGVPSSGQDDFYGAGDTGRQGEVFEHPASAEAGTYKRNIPKVGRNDPCPCGSGKKY
ncbi:MAG: preprotein translocase subunit SecA, partial [Candidatus Omnitrophica bacterium]|nr:preprotein translocase subunit SecA [Candidatus Omnitrophota bacterium]